MNITQLKAARALGCRIQIWHLCPGATSSADGQWDTYVSRPTFECPAHLYRVHPDDLHLLRAGYEQRAKEAPDCVGEPAAWLAADDPGRVIDVKAKQAAARAGGATASATAIYSIPLYTRPAPPVVGGALTRLPAKWRKHANNAYRDKDERGRLEYNILNACADQLDRALAQPQGQHPDDVAVDRFAAAMKAKLAEARAKGRSGWDDKSDCTKQFLSDLLRGHVDKGDPRDVANFCCFLWNRGEGIAQPQGRDAQKLTTMFLRKAIETLRHIVVNDEDGWRALCVLISAIKSAPQAVDLEQFRKPVAYWRTNLRALLCDARLRQASEESIEALERSRDEADRLLALIDAQHEKESAPDALVRIASELERIDGHPISGIGRSLAESLRGRAYILRAYDAQSAKGDGDA